ncbi:hypothetical protein NPIL_353431 [Nephila pilipes]|uniref:Uncharacterized protein n=1 Tax=Nephila pilipes TaxID=299642 RepID=A0A8X6TTT9_NEPPI|nr:hypothetical protein NPIL_353431 [Nephila pilipes]
MRIIINLKSLVQPFVKLCQSNEMSLGGKKKEPRIESRSISNLTWQRSTGVIEIQAQANRCHNGRDYLRLISAMMTAERIRDMCCLGTEPFSGPHQPTTTGFKEKRTGTPSQRCHPKLVWLTTPKKK